MSAIGALAQTTYCLGSTWASCGPGTAWSIAASSSTAYVSGTTDSTDGVAEFTTVAYVA